MLQKRIITDRFAAIALLVVSIFFIGQATSADPVIIDQYLMDEAEELRLAATAGPSKVTEDEGAQGQGYTGLVG